MSGFVISYFTLCFLLSQVEKQPTTIYHPSRQSESIASFSSQYEAFRAKKKAEGYTKEELKESYGFVLFDDKNKANKLGETGVVTGNGTCTTLGDPSKGKYYFCVTIEHFFTFQLTSCQ